MVCVCTSASGSIFVPRIFGALIAPVDGARDAHEPLGGDQLAGGFEEVRKHDDLNRALQIFERDVRHPIALFRQHRFHRGDDAAQAALPCRRRIPSCPLSLPWQARACVAS